MLVYLKKYSRGKSIEGNILEVGLSKEIYLGKSIEGNILEVSLRAAPLHGMPRPSSW